jgi:beta-glucosidase
VGDPAARQWPDEFLWGTDASSTQCEGAAAASDWLAWERGGHSPPSGEGNGFATRYAEDFGILADLGLVDHRLSLEWARLEPEPGVHDPGAVAHYRAVLSAAREAGISPWVRLHHFTLPNWFLAQGGFLVGRNRTDLWQRHVEFIAETFGDLVHGWQPVNEINYYARAAYGGRGWPSGHHDRGEVAVVHEAMHLAAGEAAVTLRQTGGPVASIFGLSPIIPHDDDPETHALARRLFDYYWAPGLGLYRDGVLETPGRPAMERPDLAGSFDLVGFSYYGPWGSEKASCPSIHRRPRCPPSAVGSGPTALARSWSASTPNYPALPYWSPSTGSAPTTTLFVWPISSGGWRWCKRPSGPISTCGGSFTGPRWTTTNGSMASMSTSD